MIEFIVTALLFFLCMLGADFLHRKMNRKKEKDVPRVSPESALVTGESRYHLRQRRPSGATGEETGENMEDNAGEGSNFVRPEKDSDPVPMEIDAPPFEREESRTEEEPDEEEDEAGELFGLDAAIASGVTVDEMLRTGEVIENPGATPGEEQEAGKVLYENKGTSMPEQFAQGDPQRLERIRSLMLIHETRYGITGNAHDASAFKTKDYENFNISDFIR